MNEKESCPEKPLSGAGREILRKLSDELVRALGKKDDLLDQKFQECFQRSQSETQSMTYEVPLYKKKVGCFAANQFLETHTKNRTVFSFNYDATRYKPVDYMQIQIQRGKFKTAIQFGWTRFTYKEKPFMAVVNFAGCTNEMIIFHLKEDNLLTNEIMEILRDLETKNNFMKNEKLKIVRGVNFEFLELPTLTWDELILSALLKEEIMLNLVFPLANREMCRKFDIPWRRGILLGGEPGTGKTTLAKVLCNALPKCTVIWVSAESIYECNDVSCLFQAARDLAPTLIIMEDVDFFGQDRNDGKNPILGEMLNQLDGNAPNDGIFILASTNRPDLLDKALANRPGRFDVILEVKQPNLEERTRMITLFSKGKVLSTEVSLEQVAASTDGLSGAHLKEIFTYASLVSVSKGENKISKQSMDRAVLRLKIKASNPLVR